MDKDPSPKHKPSTKRTMDEIRMLWISIVLLYIVVLFELLSTFVDL